MSSADCDQVGGQRKSHELFNYSSQLLLKGNLVTVPANKKTKFTFLHITDCHLSKSATVQNIDRKTRIDGMAPPLRADMLQATLQGLVEKLKEDNLTLDAVLFSGDGTLQGDPDGQVTLKDMLLTELASVGIKKANLIATPGNHDIVARSTPSSPSRYELFQKAWIGSDPVVVPFLDGINRICDLDTQRHVLRDPEGSWAIFPINTANWSQISIPDNENDKISLLRKHVASSGDPKLTETLDGLCTYDVARISEEQLNALKKMVKQVGDVKLRIAVLHHHLLPVDSREEFKAFSDITNLGQLRQVLRDLDFHMVVHGHKHATAAYYDHIYPDDSALSSAHRMLTISGGTFGPTGQHPDTPLRLIHIDDAPHAPICTITSFKSASAGRDLKSATSQPYRLWEDDPTSSGPSVIYGTSIDDVYARAIQTVKQRETFDRTLVCTVDFLDNTSIPFPINYPYPANKDERREWFEETVRWWQLSASRIEARIPYLHGSRLKRFGGALDQISRVVSLLKDEGETSKAIAFVVDPGRDFVVSDKPFASFCFVQFCLRPGGRLDCIGYYRAQEFNYWWPVNVAELRHLQLEIAKEATVSKDRAITPGSITTICPYPRLSENIRQPTKVAVPLIDQWVDNHPVRIAQIAIALTDKNSPACEDGLRYWKRCLDDLEQASTDYHPDGVQVAIEGLSLLEEWLAVAAGPTKITELIKGIVYENETYQKSKNSRRDYDRWKEFLKHKIAELRSLTLNP